MNSTPETPKALTEHQRIDWITAEADKLYSVYLDPLKSKEEFKTADEALNKWCRQFWPELVKAIATQAKALAEVRNDALDHNRILDACRRARENQSTPEELTEHIVRALKTPTPTGAT